MRVRSMRGRGIPGRPGLFACACTCAGQVDAGQSYAAGSFYPTGLYSLYTDTRRAGMQGSAAAYSMRGRLGRGYPIRPDRIRRAPLLSYSLQCKPARTNSPGQCHRERRGAIQSACPALIGVYRQGFIAYSLPSVRPLRPPCFAMPCHGHDCHALNRLSPAQPASAREIYAISAPADSRPKNFHSSCRGRPWENRPEFFSRKKRRAKSENPNFPENFLAIWGEF